MTKQPKKKRTPKTKANPEVKKPKAKEKGWDTPKATTMAEENYYEGPNPAGLSGSSDSERAVEDEMSHQKPRIEESPTVNEIKVYEFCPKCGANCPEHGFYGSGKFPGESEQWSPFCKCGWTAPVGRNFAMGGA